MAENDDDYEVGFGKPPKATRFVKGKSGNPSGRPKGSQNVATIFNRIALEPVQMSENGKTRTVPKIEAVHLRLMSKALSGDARATREVLQLQRIYEAAEEAQELTSVPHERDTIVMKSLLKRFQRTDQASAKQSTSDIDKPGR